MEHLSRADFERVRSGAASAEEAEALGRHVAECAECASVAGEHFGLVDAASAFEAAFTGHDEVKERSRWVPAFWVGAAAAAIAAGVFLLPQTHDPPRPVEPPPVAIASGPTASPASTLPAEWKALVAEARRTRVLPFPAEIRKLSTPDAFRGEPQDTARGELWPVATAIDDQRPELRWPASPGARYTISVMAEGKLIARSATLTAARWRIPAALPRGTMIRWQVSVGRGNESLVLPAPPAPPAIFRVISEHESEDLARARSEAKDDHLLLGLLYARAGMVEDARRELAAYERSSNDSLARDLRDQLPYYYF